MMPSTRARKRDGRCYELAAKSLLELPADTPWRLVHGTVIGSDGERFGHAWLESEREVFDPVINTTLPAVIYRARFRAEGGTSYSFDEAARRVLAGGLWGPWDLPADR